MPGGDGADAPCQVIVQPPDWMPMLSALCAGHEDPSCRSGPSGSTPLRVLEQHLRLAHRLARQSAVASELPTVAVSAPVGERVLEEAQLELHA